MRPCSSRPLPLFVLSGIVRHAFVATLLVAFLIWATDSGAATVTCSGPCNKPAICDICPQDGDTVNLTQGKVGGGTCTATLTVTQVTQGSGGTVVGTASSSSGCGTGCANVDQEGTTIGFTAVWGLLPATQNCFKITGSVNSTGQIWFQVRDQAGSIVLDTSDAGAPVSPGFTPNNVRAALSQNWSDGAIALIEDDGAGDFCFSMSRVATSRVLYPRTEAPGRRSGPGLRSQSLE